MILIIGGTILLMFGLMWWSKRRYGPVALGLVVGLVLADWWASQVALLLDGVGWRLSGLPSRGLAALLLLLLPAGLLLLGGNKYANGRQALLAAAALAAFLAALLVPVLGDQLVLDGVGATVYGWLGEHWQRLATVGLVYAVIDTGLPAAHHHSKRGRPKKS